MTPGAIFQGIVGRAATKEDVQRLHAIKEALGLRDDDYAWAIVILLDEAQRANKEAAARTEKAVYDFQQSAANLAGHLDAPLQRVARQIAGPLSKVLMRRLLALGIIVATAAAVAGVGVAVSKTATAIDAMAAALTQQNEKWRADFVVSAETAQQAYENVGRDFIDKKIADGIAFAGQHKTEIERLLEIENVRPGFMNWMFENGLRAQDVFQFNGNRPCGAGPVEAPTGGETAIVCRFIVGWKTRSGGPGPFGLNGPVPRTAPLYPK